jgi:hypothetical protein
VSRERFSTQVARDIQDRVRAAVRGVAREAGGDYSLAQLTEEALAVYVEQLEADYNAGQPFPATDRLRRGRRVGD